VENFLPSTTFLFPRGVEGGLVSVLQGRLGKGVGAAATTIRLRETRAAFLVSRETARRHVPVGGVGVPLHAPAQRCRDHHQRVTTIW
jgi:hypothetical protein